MTQIFSHIIDISLEMESTLPLPGDPPFNRTLAHDIASDGCEVAELRMSAHHGTHLDFPSHFIPGGRRQGDYPAEAFVLPALVFETGEERPRVLTIQDLEEARPAPGQALLLKTANTRLGLHGKGRSAPEFTTLGPETASWLAESGCPLVGIDACSIERLDSPDYAVHKTLLAAGVLILEGLDLAKAPAGRHTLVCAPLSIAGAEASPVRALLLR